MKKFCKIILSGVRLKFYFIDIALAAILVNLERKKAKWLTLPMGLKLNKPERKKDWKKGREKERKE